MNMPTLCQCGCGQPAPICTHTDKKANLQKGEFRRFRRGHHFKLCTNNPATKRRNPVSRFWAKVSKTDGCWLWTGGRSNDGYGNFDNKRPHRFSYELAFGPIPPKLNICHHCDTPLCVRPEHLFVGTQKDNIQDALAKNRMSHSPRGFTKENAEKTHCLHGHPLSGVNLIFDYRGHRSCLVCRRIRGRVHDAKRRERHRQRTA